MGSVLFASTGKLSKVLVDQYIDVDAQDLRLELISPDCSEHKTSLLGLYQLVCTIGTVLELELSCEVGYGYNNYTLINTQNDSIISEGLIFVN